MLPHTLVHWYNSTQNVTSSSRSGEGGARSRLEELETRLDRSHLIIQTLLILLLEKKVIHEDEFKEWLVFVDELDGTRDGKIKEAGSPVECPKCNRKNPRMAPKCIYCGEPFEVKFLSRRPPANPGIP